MSNLLETQRRIASMIMQPLTRTDGMRQRTSDGRSVKAEAEALMKPNQQLTSFERLEIYNRQYWFRLLTCLAEDFPGLRAIVGDRQFEALARAYLTACPSSSFTLRDLGSRLEQWLLAHPEWIAPQENLALDMARLEWAHIEAFDGGCEPGLTLADIQRAGLNGRLSLQPYLRLLKLSHSVDDLLIEVHVHQSDINTSITSTSRSQIRKRVRCYAQPGRKRVYLAVHRADHSVYYKRLQRESYLLLKSLSLQKSMEQAVHTAFRSSSMPQEEQIQSIQQWFENWAELGWFCRPTFRHRE